MDRALTENVWSEWWTSRLSDLGGTEHKATDLAAQLTAALFSRVGNLWNKGTEQWYQRRCFRKGPFWKRFLVVTWYS